MKPMPPDSEDPRDFQTFAAFYNDPTATVKEVAKRKNIPYSTVQRRWNDMRKEGILSYTISYRRLHKFKIDISVDPAIQSDEFGYFTQREFATFLKHRLLDLPKHRH